MKSFILHLVIAILWLLLSEKPSLGSFAVGIVLGFILLYLFQAVLGGYSYVHRCLGLARYLVIFTRAFLLSSVNVALISFRRHPENLRPGFLRYDVTGLNTVETIILSYSIALTPGTTPADLEDGGKTLIVHVIDLSEPEKVENDITNILLTNILKFTRKQEKP